MTTTTSIEPSEVLSDRYPLGQLVIGIVEHHAPFGIFLNINHPIAKGLIKLPDFLDQGIMKPTMYPPIGAKVGAIVVGYNESNQREVYLSARPTVLHQALVPLNLCP